jgi:formate/nitrite transporter FocA (FNT family)
VSSSTAPEAAAQDGAEEQRDGEGAANRFATRPNRPGGEKEKKAGGDDREREEAEAQERRSVSAKVVHEAIEREGEEELERPPAALAWSGLAAGLAMGFSMIGQGLLRAHLPDAPWRPLLVSLGYSLGFLIVILGRQQLFTENTLTPVLPVLRRSKPFSALMRLWGIVLATNLAGALLFALAAAYTDVFPPGVRDACAALAREAAEGAFATQLLRGVFAGWLIALLVWLLPGAESARFAVVVTLTYVVALGHFTHVIAGAVEVFYGASVGALTWGHALGGYVLPALVGNVLGGTTLVALLNHAQVCAGQEKDGRRADG